MDNALVRSARDGDQRAYSKLVEGYYRSIYGLAFSAVGDWQAAEDIAQDAFLVAWVNLGKLRSLDAFGAWLRRIARNLAKNWIRSKRYRLDLLQHRDVFDHESEPNQSSAVETLARADTRAEIWEALETLSPMLREVVVLFYLEENSIAQTAAMLGITENSVKKRLQHARPKLRRHFEKKWMVEMERERRRVNPRDAGKRFMGGAALGPVSVMAGRLGSDTGLWLHGALHGEGTGRLASLLSVASTPAKPVLVALVVVAVSGAGILWNAQRAGTENGQPQSLAAEPVLHAAVPAVSVEAPSAAAVDETEASESSIVDESSAAAFGLAATEDAAQFITVAGRVVDEEQRPIQGATVTVVASGLESPSMGSGPSFGGAGGVGGGGFGGGFAGGGGGEFGSGGSGAAAFGGGGSVGGGFGGGSFSNARGVPTLAPSHLHEEALTKALLDESRRFSVESAADGSFSITDVPGDGLLIVSGSAPGYCVQGETISPTSGDITDRTLTLSPGISIKGQALSASGEPVADALVQVTALAWKQASSAGGWGRSPLDWGWSRTDAEGTFTIAVEESGNATVVVQSQTEGKATFPDIHVEPGAFAVLRFPELSVVRGKLILHDGTPASGHTIQLTGHVAVIAVGGNPQSQSWGETAGPAYDAIADAAGDYRIEGVDPRMVYTVGIYDVDGTPLATGMDLDSPVAGQPLVWKFTIPQPIIVKGIVTMEAAGQPAIGTIILGMAAIVASEDGIPLAMPAARAVTGPDGAYEMRITTGPGEYVFGFQSLTGFHSLSQREVHDGESVVMNLSLPGSWSRDFLALDESGNPLPGVVVSIMSEGSEMSWGYPQQTGDDGRVRVTDLIAGEAVKCRFQYEGFEAESDSMVGEEGAEYPEAIIVIDTSR